MQKKGLLYGISFAYGAPMNRFQRCARRLARGRVLHAALLTTLVALALPRDADACEPSPDDGSVVYGLGQGTVDGTPRPTITIPRNYAYVSGYGGLVQIPGSELPLYRHASLLEVGEYKSLGVVAVVEDVVDTSPPSTAPVIASGTLTFNCAIEGCWGLNQDIDLEIGVRPEDDRTPADRITYAIFGGPTEEEAEATKEVSVFRILEADGRTLSIHITNLRYAWYSVSPIDLAGNVGPRSKAIRAVQDRTNLKACSASTSPTPAQANQPGESSAKASGCSASTSSTQAGQVALGSVVLCLALTIRRRRRAITGGH